MKKIKGIALGLLCALVFVSCSGGKSVEKIELEPQISQMKSICELAVMECYYHNVAKYSEKDATGALWWKKDKHFWIEYSGIVKLGIDVSLLDMQVNGSQITITLPKAKVQGCKVDSSSLTKDSYIVDKNSAPIQAEDEILAFAQAQQLLEETAANDTSLLNEAQQRAQILLEDYVTNIGNAVGKEYRIQWVYPDGKPSDFAPTPSPSQNPQSTASNS